MLFRSRSFSNGAAYGDLDNDGDLDLVISNENGPAFIYRNNSRELTQNNYLGVFLKGKDKNTFAIGSKICLYAAGQIFTRELVPSRGFQSSMAYKQIIGLGPVSKVDSMIITWPDRSQSRFLNPAINKVDTIRLSGNTTTPPASTPAPIDSSRLLLQIVKSSFEKHREDDYTDFYYERNLPKMLSREGPKATVGDVNGDGLPDVYIGGTNGHPGQIYCQTPDGQFVKKDEPDFTRFADFEDEAVLFFDADNDGDLDLFIGPGGNNSPPYTRQMQFRLFKNDGHGIFTIDAAAFPSNDSGMNTAIAVAGDFNKDGYPDLFIGGRSIPRQYGLDPPSFIFLNDGKGHFTDIAKTKNPDIAHIGMVTGAVWANLTGDDQKQLVITGEWMAPQVFTFKKEDRKSVV